MEKEKIEIINTAETYWKYIKASFSPNTCHVSNIMPTINIINIKDKYRKVRGKTNWNENKKILSINTTRHDVFLYLNKNKLNSKMKLTLIHELLHARGYNHGYIQKLKFSSHSYNDQVSKAVLKGIMILEKGKTIREIKINVNGPDKRTFIVIKRLQKYMRIKTEIEEFFYYFPF